ncbi:MAG: TonB-dependent receptor [Burkholderiales bacterium]|nr:TonB-dependent receptor [Burkholderiales bacterium]MDE2504706.1 TonB-dependent receptor [Burkholderiales bacterium]
MKLKTVAGSLALLGLAGPVLAQSTEAPAQRVEVTGSRIKGVRDEGALPLQVITAKDIQQQGLVSADDVLRALSANSLNANNPVSSNSVFGQEGDRLAGGGSYANLRGLGPTGTLVLLNGRRLSNQGMSGGAVDLNAIPIEMIDRIEVLKDGASAIYGTDAIGGVINFILKRDYQGLQASAQYSTPLQSGGGQRRKISISGGWGKLDSQGYNVSANISRSTDAILRGVDRPWTAGYQPALGLAPDTTSSPYFANIIGSNGTALPSSGTTIGATDPTKYTVINALALGPGCASVPFGVSQQANPTVLTGFGYTVPNSTYRCGTDYGRQYMLTAPSETTSGVLRANFNLGNQATGFVEFVGSRTYSLGEFVSYQFSTTSNPVTNYPVGGPYYANMQALYGANNFDPTKPIAYRLRMQDWGYRTLGNESTNDRLALGVDGTVGNYDYSVSLSRGEAAGYAEMVDGYADTNKLVALLASGLYNPFLMPGQSQTPQAMAAVDATKVHGRMFGGKTRVDELIANVSGNLYKLPAGDLAFSLGTDLRREFYGFTGSQFYNCVSTFTVANMALPNSVMGCPGNAAAPDTTRGVSAVYGELLVPVLSSLELRAALRYDRYQGIGGTTNPKIAFKFTPTRSLLFRGSYNTGFRAPTPQQLNLGQVQLATTGSIADPLLCPNPKDPAAANNPSCSLTSVPYMAGGNPNLKPETSRQASLGMVFSPLKDMSASIDYWQIRMNDRIHNLTVSQELANYAVFAHNFTRDPATQAITSIQAGWINAGGSMTKGLDIAGSYTTPLLGNRLDLSLTATKMISDQEQLITGTPMIQYVGQWTNTTLYLPWKANLAATYRTPQVSTTLSAFYASGYNDEDHTTLSSVPAFHQRHVASYTTFNLVTTISPTKNLQISVGALNLFDRTPPFTWHDVDNAVGTGWDPRVADPRGLTGQFSLRYTFF